MSCGCGLKPRIELDPNNAVRVNDLLPKGAMDELREHLLHEEQEIIPNLPIWAQTTIMLDHARFWHDLARGRMPNRFDLEAHAGKERLIYKQFGLAHQEAE